MLANNQSDWLTLAVSKRERTASQAVLSHYRADKQPADMSLAFAICPKSKVFTFLASLSYVHMRSIWLLYGQRVAVV